MIIFMLTDEENRLGEVKQLAHTDKANKTRPHAFFPSLVFFPITTKFCLLYSLLFEIFS